MDDQPEGDRAVGRRHDGGRQSVDGRRVAAVHPGDARVAAEKEAPAEVRDGDADLVLAVAVVVAASVEGVREPPALDRQPLRRLALPRVGLSLGRPLCGPSCQVEGERRTAGQGAPGGSGRQRTARARSRLRLARSLTFRSLVDARRRALPRRAVFQPLTPLLLAAVAARTLLRCRPIEVRAARDLDARAPGALLAELLAPRPAERENRPAARVG